MQSGIVQHLVAAAGYGFIKDARGGSVFFHASTCSGGRRFADLAVGDAVRFEIAALTTRGRRARRVWT